MDHPENSENTENQNIEISLLLEALRRKYGYDFSDYSRPHIRRRILGRVMQSGLESVSQLQHKILYDPSFLQMLLLDLSLNVTEMFRDPKFFHALRNDVIPILKTYPFIKIWHAGCSTGEEVYSMAILLKEEGLLERSLLYATDFNQNALDIAAEGIFRSERLKQYATNYISAGGKYSFSEYFTAHHQAALISKHLKSKIVFANHNLVTDGVFGEMNLIICRNVLIYFNNDLKNRVFELFAQSLLNGGILCLGTKESLMLTDIDKKFRKLSSLNIFKKNY